MKKIFKNPVYETSINRAFFINQDITVYPMNTPCPKNLPDVVRFLFGEGACVVQDVTNNPSCLIIRGGSYVLQGVKTLNADWTIKEIEQEG